MNHSRRNLLQGAGAGFALAALSGAAHATGKTRKAAATASGTKRSTDKKIDIVNFDLLEQRAKAIMSEPAYAFIAHGSGDEWTLRENRRAFNDYPIRTHRLAGVAADNVDLGVELLGQKLPFPIVVAPMGAQMFANPEAEIAAAAGTGAAGTLYQSSGASNRPLEEIAKATTGPKWFQLYFNADINVTQSLLERARNAGYSAIIITADALGPGASDAFIELGKPFPPGFSFGNHDPRYGGIGNFRNQKIDLIPDDIRMVKSVSKLPVIVKGIMRGTDADMAIKARADAIQVSNHGGRQLDGVPGAISVLKEVSDAVGNRVPVLFDSGIRRGIDVFRALCLGASAVAVGRPVLYGSAVGGAAGVQSVLEHVHQELKLVMLLAGAKSVKDLSPEYLKI